MLPRIFSCLVSIALAQMVIVSNSHAALLEGQQVVAGLQHKDTSASLEVGDESGIEIVGPEVEIEDLGARIAPVFLQSSVIVDVDFSDQQIVITAVNNQPLSFKESMQISVLGSSAPRVTDVSINPATNWPEFEDARLLSSNQNIFVTLTGLTASQGQQIVLDLIPEPAAAGLALPALAVLALARRGRRET